MDGGKRRFFLGGKKTVGGGSLHLVASRKAMDGENIQEPG